MYRETQRNSSPAPAPTALRRAARPAVLFVVALAIWALAGRASATMPFTPAFDLSVSNANVGATANVTFAQSVPAGNHLIDSVNTFIPIDWQIAAGDTYPAGNVVGQVSAKADKGCNGSVDTLLPGNLVNQTLAPTDPSQAEWLAIVDGSWQLLFIVEQTNQPREWQISVTLNNASMPAGMCSPQELKVTINGSASPGGAQVIANPTHADTYLWEDGLLSLGGSHIEFVSDSVVIGTDTDADGLANTVDADDDNDGFSDVLEASTGTSPLLACGVNAWPADINNDGFSDISDITPLAGWFGESVPPAPPRYNIAPDPPDLFVDITDITRMAGLFGQSCS